MGKKKRKISLKIEFEQYPFSSMKGGPEFETEILYILKNALSKDLLIIKELDTSNAYEIQVESIILK